eukprot:NODE_2327_length_2235_cov_10.299810.p1 GENE.NODE_2327_length_2235_cov_10.299810~~NODE_2327_length_2235_cov_10.299810.p1  ORF type:complete len:660 (-),score=172.84 NODE_2327_length_2235_cov_10.299810:255-2234(-)
MSFIFLAMRVDTGVFSPKGRCFSFDATADGIVRCDTTVCLMLKNVLLESNEEDETIPTWFEDPKLGAICGSAMNQSGRRANITSPDGMAQQEVTFAALRKAGIGPLDVDVVSCQAHGAIISDAIEVSSALRMLRNEDERGIEAGSPLVTAAGKSCYGNADEACGLSEIIKVCICSMHTTITPMLHLRYINPHIDIGICSRPAALLTEVVPFLMDSTYVGIQAQSIGGTNVHVLVWGQDRSDEREHNFGELRSINYWPGQSLDELAPELMPVTGYYISGTFSSWQPRLMVSEADKTHSFVLTLGENRWEAFQVWIDGDPYRALYPEVSPGGRWRRVKGPEPTLRAHSWCIDGRSNSTEYPAEKIGKQYKVTLHVNGNWQSVDWLRLDDAGLKAPEPSTFQVAGIWTDWELEEMKPDNAKPGCHNYLLRVVRGEPPRFMIIRNRDWLQAIHECGTGYAIGGDMGQEHHFELEQGVGEPGDIFNITVYHQTDDNGPTMLSVTWTPVQPDDGLVSLLPMTPAITLRTVFFMVGTWDNYRSPWPMRCDEGFLEFWLELGPALKISFFILCNDGDWALNPSVDDASPHEPHELNAAAYMPHVAGNLWTIGLHPADDGCKNQRYMLRLIVERAGVDLNPLRVEWEPLAYGTQVDEFAGRGLFVKGP